MKLTHVVRNISDLKFHPKNYRVHNATQLEHLKHSIQQHGIYRNIVLADDNTILAGHGVVMACKELGMTTVLAVVVPFASDSPLALKILIGDNDIGKLAAINEDMLVRILKIAQEDDLLGTGYDSLMLSALEYCIRNVKDTEPHKEEDLWVGMPSYEPKGDDIVLTIIFQSEEEKILFAAVVEQKILSTTDAIWWPKRENDDIKSVRYAGDKS